VIKVLFEHFRNEIHGMIHCSGGAQTKVLHFVKNLHIIKDNLFPIPPLFRMIQEQSGTPLREMYQVFNMGHRMELYVPADVADEIISVSESFGIAAQMIGRCEKWEGKKLTILTSAEKFEY
jgi:phosphoribosylformylglycinamidine cyclo-ligase